MRSCLYILFIFFIILLCFSCSVSRLKVPKDDLKTVHIGFKGTFNNKSIDTLKKHISLSNLLGFYKEKPKSITLEITPSKEIKVGYTDSLGKKQIKLLKGKLHKKGYFQYFPIKERIEIPPLFSIIFSKVHIRRIRLTLTRKNNLIIDEYLTYGGNIFIFAGGSTNRNQYHFSPITINIQ